MCSIQAPQYDSLPILFKHILPVVDHLFCQDLQADRCRYQIVSARRRAACQVLDPIAHRDHRRHSEPFCAEPV